MDAPISASLGAMGSVIRKLEELLGEASEDEAGDPFHRLRLRLGFKDGVALVHLLRKNIEEIFTYLEDLSEVEDPPLTARCWMKEVRELSYDIEDYIDSFARPARCSNTRTRSRSKSMGKVSHVELAHLPNKKLRYKQAANKISDFIIRAHEAKKRYQRYDLDWHNLKRRNLPVGPMLWRQFQEGTDLVIDGQMSDLIATLASDGDHQLKVVCIVGSGGIGKTTLVRLLYNKIRGKFQFRAFIQMTRKPNVKIVLRQLLKQVQRQPSDDHYDEGLDLISKIRERLQDKRYLIIVEDLWSTSEWNIINKAFPEGNQRSRIIVTTQIEDIALTCCSYHSGFVHEMRPHDSYHSRKLFFNRVFGSETDCPDTLKEVSNKIVEICGGLPLATVSMASLLASHPVVLVEQWRYISDSLSSSLRTSPATEGVRQVLNLSYNNLTHYLKTCLLYLNMYPEGYTIWKDDLVKQWVAEGFIDATEGQDMESVAGSYFDELSDRRFLQPACIKHNNATVSCTVHDMVHDLIAYKSVEENFVMVVDSYRKNVELCDKVHRLSLQFGDTKHAKKPADIKTSQVRSLFFFGLFMCMPSITEFKLLRVLNLQLSGHNGDEIFNLTGISKLFQLRYLKVASDVCIELPKHMQGLQYLETLEMDAEVTAVPWDIIHLPCLLHLQLPFETNLTDWIGRMRSESVQKLGKLTNLRDLRLICSTTPPPDHLEQNMEAIGSLLTGLGNLKTLTLVRGSFHTKEVVRGPSNITISWDRFASPLLQRFEWSTSCCTFSRVPKWIREFGNLCVLKITVKELLRDGVDILKGLPALTTLSLYVLAAPVERIIFDKAGFSVLMYFKYRCSAPWLKFEAGAMPNLWKLKLGFNAHKVDQHSSTHISIEHLPGLQEISVKVAGAGADAESDLAAAIVNHPSNPQINMQSVDWIFYEDKGTIKKEHGRIEKHVIMEESGEKISRNDMDRKKEEEAQRRIENVGIMKGTEYLVSRKDEDESKHTGERKRRRIEQQDDIMEDENKQAIISNFTASIPSPHMPMVSSRPYAYTVVTQLDIEEILKEAQHRWLRPAEICEILQNYRNFRIAPEPPNRPPSGSLFLFDRKVLRYFRKDGHNWRKKKDQKTVIEAYEKLKSGSTDVLHCYYARGEENINFQRRTYRMLEENSMHIVLVHYLETKGGAKSFRTRNMIPETGVHSPSSLTGQASECSSVVTSDTPASSVVTSAKGLGVEYLTHDPVYSDCLSPKDVNTAGTDGESFWQVIRAGPVIDSSAFSSYTPASSVGNYQGLHSTQNTSFYPVNQHNSPLILNESSSMLATNSHTNQTDLPSWNAVIELDNEPVQMPPLQFPVPPAQGASTEGLGVDYLTFDEVYSDGLGLKDIGAAGTDSESFLQFSSATGDLSATENSFPQQNDGSLEAAIGYPFLKTQSSNLSDILKDSFKKTDSFTRWMSKELLDVEDSQIQSSSGAFWSTEEANNIIEASSREPLDQFTVSPMLSQDQLFSIVDFAPNWTYVGSKTKILVIGSILNNSQITERCKWSCMFGEVEVPAKILADGTLICYSPQHKPGRVPFYITCSNRLACSEVREFEFRPTVSQYMDAPSPHGATNKVYFQIRLDKLLSLGPDGCQATVSNPSLEMIDLSKKISSLMTSNDEWSNLLKLAVDNEPSTDDQQDQFAENLIKEKLHVWLVNKVGMGGKGPSVLDDEGQGVLHLAAALGYDWAIRPTLAAGVNINFRDVHGWTALHWAAFCGRERTVVALIALGAAPGALTDPTPDFPGSTPADLASANGQKGISGFLAESSLTSHLQALNLKEANMAEISGLPGIGDVTERDPLQPPSADSLGPVRNAAQAAARIYQVFRVQSFQRKQAAQYEDDKGGMSDERALSLLSVKPPKSGQLDPLHSAATRIQNKFRGWKGRKEFLLIRQRIVKIQAHVRGHQVRKHYRKIVWSVGIVEKVILRWRRRGAGLRGFRSTESSMESSSGGTSSSLIQDKPSGDDYDFLQEGRKQTEERLQKALARVKSMAQYPEARDQYQRILTVVSKMQESQAVQEKMLEESAEMDEGYFMSEFKELWDDDTPIPGYF